MLFTISIYSLLREIILKYLIKNSNYECTNHFCTSNEESFCAALCEKLIEGLDHAKHQVKVQKLYQENFNPLLSKEELSNKKAIENDQLALKYRNDIEWAENIAIIHPAWWYGVPAILKGYFDRLLTEGFSYDYYIDHAKPKFTSKRGVVIQTFDGEEKLEKELFDDLTFKSVYFTWMYCGITNWIKKQYFRANFVTEEQRKKWLEEIYILGFNIQRIMSE